jgi:hypothetical protein
MFIKRDFRRAMMVLCKNKIGECLSNLKSLKGKTDTESNIDRAYQRAILGANVKHLARFKKENPDITGPRARQLSLVL